MQNIYASDGAVYVLPIYTQGISTVEVEHPTGELRVLGTSKKSGYIVVKRVDKKTFESGARMPRIEKVSPTKLLIRPPRRDKYYTSSLIMEIYVPRMQTLNIRGESIRLKIADIPQLKQLRVNARQADVDLYQTRLKYELDVETGNIFVSKCQKCQGSISSKRGRIYIKGGSGDMAISAQKVDIVSNGFKGSQTFQVSEGITRLFGARGTVSLRGQRPSVYVRRGVPENLDIWTPEGDIYVDFQKIELLELSLKAPKENFVGFPALLMSARQVQRDLAGLIQSPAFAAGSKPKRVSIQTLKGKLHFLIK